MAFTNKTPPIKTNIPFFYKIHIIDGVGFACLPMDCPDSLIAIISDFILSLNVVDLSVIYAVRKDGIKFSVRSERRDINAGKLVAEVLKNYGN